MSIYKIYNDNECYIGKTTVKYVSSRISKHRYLFNSDAKYQCSSKIILSKEGWKWCVLESNIDKDKLSEREQYYINNSEGCVNVSKVLLSKEEKLERNRELHKKYYEKNKGTDKDPNFNRQEYKAIWKLKKKYGDDWINHTRKYKKI